ncbi:hypothetical protein B0F90DRAFT_1768640 [Multifurca ochricompacta]|uniref:DUF6533 domain-containing protein n=1 Tax=Multifurca ochricompacta TaxID=376703 RepID=A0AAD4LWT7_9AGAM|nr:hypothetical protein B0F90DRAFT_1768640 [Multifurca ochricompacta]
MLTLRDVQLDEDYRNSYYVGLAGYTVLLWDHIITFDDEVEYIWKGKKGLRKFSFLIANRYLIPCRHFVRYEGAMTMIGVSVAAIMMFLRIRVLYARVLEVQALVIIIFLTFVGVNSWLLSNGVRTSTSSSPFVQRAVSKLDGPIASSSAWLPLLYDTVVVSLTLIRTTTAMTSKPASQIFRVLLQEGLLYYRYTSSLVGAFKNLTFTVAMVSRITLHLKRFGHRSHAIIFQEDQADPTGRSASNWYLLSRSLGRLVFAHPDNNRNRDTQRGQGQPPDHLRLHQASSGLPTLLEEETFFGTETFSKSTPHPFLPHPCPDPEDCCPISISISTPTSTSTSTPTSAYMHTQTQTQTHTNVLCHSSELETSVVDGRMPPRPIDLDELVMGDEEIRGIGEV